jgi:hypothetical protein
MSILADFDALASPVFAGRVYRNSAGDSPTVPYATFFRVVGIEGSTLDRNGGTDNETNTRIQLDVYSRSGTELDTLVGAMKAALKAWSVSNVILMEMDDYESDTKLHRTTLDISTWHQ